jgi:hypothetical protein
MERFTGSGSIDPEQRQDRTDRREIAFETKENHIKRIDQK